MYEGDAVEDVFSGFLFIDIPILHYKKSYFSVAAAMGLALNCNQYHFAEEPTFMQTSSYANVYSHIVLSYHYQPTSQIDVGLGGRFQHFSNGGWQYPNHGMEMASVQVSLSYLFSSQKYERPFRHFLIRSMSLFLCLLLGFLDQKHNYKDQYLYTNLSFGYSVVRRPFYAFGAGVDFTYNAALEERFSSSYTATDAIYAGVFISNELLFRDVRLGVQVGTHVYDKVKFSVPVYERLILRYQMFERTFLHFGIKLNGGKSECLEWGLGFVI